MKYEYNYENATEKRASQEKYGRLDIPHDDPKYAISVIIEHGGSGASTAAPIAKQVFTFINELKV